ncbi:hypothetical protein FRC03_002186 [Tulasnella sp. 419]|nr:hypothetical protein FRC03_002186 [Tulasnella sp. 419]
MMSISGQGPKLPIVECLEHCSLNGGLLWFTSILRVLPNTEKCMLLVNIDCSIQVWTSATHGTSSDTFHEVLIRCVHRFGISKFFRVFNSIKKRQVMTVINVFVGPGSGVATLLINIVTPRPPTLGESVPFAMAISSKRHVEGREGYQPSRNCWCGRNFKTVEDAIKHARDSTSRHPFFCAKCEVLFNNEDDEKCHDILYHDAHSEGTDDSSDMSTSQVSTGPIDNEVPICKVCLNRPDDKVVTDCGHLYCRKCITSALMDAPRCPVCRVFTTMGGYVLSFSRNI